MPDASALIAALYGLGRAGLIDNLLELGHALAVAGHVAGSELRSRETGERTECMVRQDKTCILGGSTATGLRRMGGGPFPAWTSASAIRCCCCCYTRGRAGRAGRAACLTTGRQAGRQGHGHTVHGLLGLLLLLKKGGGSPASAGRLDRRGYGVRRLLVAPPRAKGTLGASAVSSSATCRPGPCRRARQIKPLLQVPRRATGSVR